MNKQFTIKYRPKNWKDIIGHEKIVKECIDRVKDKDFPTVSYFTGLYGSGKDTIILIYLKAMFCKDVDKEGNPCNKCRSCLAIDNKQFSAVNGLEVYNASDIAIDKARQIGNEIKSVMFGDQTRRVYVFNELQEFKKNMAALRNLLETFETPIDDVHFIFNSMEYVTIESPGSKNAIGSRTVLYKLNPLKYDKIFSYLGSICEKENVVIDEQKANILLMLAENSNGSMREAISKLERVIKSSLWTENEIMEELMMYSENTISDIINGLTSKKVFKINFEITEELITSIKYRLSIVMKSLSGFKLNSYEKDKIKTIKKADSNTLIFIMNELMEIVKMPYFDKNFATFKFFSILNNDDSEVTTDVPVKIEQTEQSNLVRVRIQK